MSARGPYGIDWYADTASEVPGNPFATLGSRLCCLAAMAVLCLGVIVMLCRVSGR
ncbi:hypothetical protein [Collinsella bouchesdurhonensis]|uniref:hypothetical protein n=1 Tax=Collinsella bouchesdurhonensis TaxID=1907654 RepID=UPI00356274C7